MDRITQDGYWCQRVIKYAQGQKSPKISVYPLISARECIIIPNWHILASRVDGTP